MRSKELITYKCPRCNKLFRTDNSEDKICYSCRKYESPHQIKKVKVKKPAKPLSFSDVSYIIKVYEKRTGKYLHYGEAVNLIEANAEHCVCCGATIPEGKHICFQCENG